MAHPTPPKDPMDREFTPQEIHMRGALPNGGGPFSTLPRKKLDQGELEKREKSGPFLITTKEMMGKREQGTAKKSALDGTSSGFSAPPTPVDFGFDQLTGSKLKK